MIQANIRITTVALLVGTGIAASLAVVSAASVFRKIPTTSFEIFTNGYTSSGYTSGYTAGYTSGYTAGYTPATSGYTTTSGYQK